MAVTVQWLYVFATMFGLQILSACLEQRRIERLHGADVTDQVTRRVSDNVAAALVRSGIRVIHKSDAVPPVVIAALHMALPRMIILTDYNFAALSQEFEDFMIAHELGHYKRRDPLILTGTFSASMALLITLLLQFMPRQQFIVGASVGSVLIVLGVFLFALPLQALLRRPAERFADAYAAELVGVDAAIRGLQFVKPRGIVKGRKHFQDIDYRIAQLSRLYRKSDRGVDPVNTR